MSQIPDDNIIKLEGVNFYYNKNQPNELHALKDINLEIKRGDFVSFFGSSGCGKSTMLYMVSGIDKPGDGKVFFNGHDITDFSSKETSIYRQMGIGLVFQNFNLIPSLSVMDNVALPMTFLGLTAEKRKKRTLEILKYLNISDLADRLPYELSGGQQQRVGIARALANDPPLILADEPTGNLDSVNAKKTMELLRELCSEHGKTVILVTHEAWCLKYVDKIFSMKDGMVIKTETRKVEPENLGAEDGKGIEGGSYQTSPVVDKIDVLVGSFASFFLRGYSKKEVERGEGFFKKRINHEFTHDEFVEALDKPFKEGGLGLWKQKAKNIADMVEEIIKENYEMSIIYSKLEKYPDSPLNEEISNIRKWILKNHNGKLSLLQTDSLDECVGERIRNIITPDNFVKVVTLPRREGGVGFPIPTALRISNRLEMLIDANSK
jgi:putative ABC transport system ATP-binding protein